MKLHLQGKTGKIEANVKRIDDKITVSVGDNSFEYSLQAEDGHSYLISNKGVIYHGVALRVKDEIFLHGLGRSHRFEEISDDVAALGDSHSGDLRVIAPMPGTIIKVLVEVGMIVKKGQALVIVEAMKMENEVRSAADAVVEKIMVSVGERVGFGHELLKLAPPQEDGGQTKLT